MSSSQVITGLANKTIDGFESDPGSIIPRGQQESFNYYTETNHIASLNLLMINKGILESMPAEYQDVIKTVFKDICVKQCYDRVDFNNELTQVMIDAGVEVVTLDPEVFEEFRASAYAFSAKQIEAEGVQEFVDEAMAYVAANKK
jgi:TRAP-type C4-dicarboxylate transport system substrate-binding protein